jgi:hypothetical protein
MLRRIQLVLKKLEICSQMTNLGALEKAFRLSMGVQQLTEALLFLSTGTITAFSHTAQNACVKKSGLKIYFSKGRSLGGTR